MLTSKQAAATEANGRAQVKLRGHEKLSALEYQELLNLNHAVYLEAFDNHKEDVFKTAGKLIIGLNTRLESEGLRSHFDVDTKTYTVKGAL